MLFNGYVEMAGEWVWPDGFYYFWSAPREEVEDILGVLGIGITDDAVIGDLIDACVGFMQRGGDLSDGIGRRVFLLMEAAIVQRHNGATHYRFD